MKASISKWVISKWRGAAKASREEGLSAGRSITPRRNREADILLLEKALIAGRPKPEAPADMREDIMRQLRNTGRKPVEARPGSRFNVLRWVPVPALAAVLVFTLYFSHLEPSETPGIEAASLRVASQMLRSDEQLGSEFTSAMVGPLNEEMMRVDADLKRMAEYVLASVP